MQKTKAPVYVGMDLTTTDDKVAVDRKLLESMFRGFKPYSLDLFKSNLKSLIDGCESIEEIVVTVDNHLYVTKIATEYHNKCKYEEELASMTVSK